MASAPFIDTHVHFWDQRLLPYPWLVEVPAIAGPHTPAELRAEAVPDQPAKMVFVECGAPGLEEVKWITQLAATEPRLAGIVAKISVDAVPPRRSRSPGCGKSRSCAACAI